MNKNRRHAMVFLGVLSLAAVLSGAAAAGNPHGTPPGQAKKSSQATVHATAQATAHATVHQVTHAGVRGKHQSTAVVTTSTAAGNSVGVKAGATTGFGMRAAAGSSATKSYGNGRTAGQIAEQNGAGASTVLYGPGNSQPHKAALCFDSKVHLIDVHALKAHGTVFSCVALSGTAALTTSVSTSGSTGVHGNGHAFGHANGHVNGVVGAKAGVKAKATVKHSRSRKGAVLGANASLVSSVNGQARPAQAVLGTANFTG